MTYLLAIETTGKRLSVALAAGNRVIERRIEGELNHLKELVPTVAELLAAEGVALSELGAIAVSAGPGSFTGIRIGITTARAFAQAAGVPVMRVPTLETFVFGAPARAVVCPMLDARRGQVYAGAYRLAADGVCDAGDCGTLAPAENGAAIGTLVDGAAWDPGEFEAALAVALRRAGAAPEDVVRLSDSGEPQSAAHVARWALMFGEPIEYGKLEPIYMRKAEAQRRLEERLAAGERQAE